MLNDFRVYGVSLSKDLSLFFVTEETFIFAGRMCDCIMQGKVFLRLLALCGGLLCGASLFAQQVRFALNAQTGAVDSLFVEKAEGIKWLMRTDGSQYKWITADYGWGLGYFTEIRDGVPTFRSWKEPASQPTDSLVRYRCGEVEVAVTRCLEAGSLLETYTHSLTSAVPT